MFEISSVTREQLEEEISHANNDSPKFIFFETCDFRKVYFCPKHLNEAYFDSRPCTAEADESIGDMSLAIYTNTSPEPFFATQDGLDPDNRFLDLADANNTFINVETASSGFKLISINTIVLAMTEKDLFD